MYEPVDHFRADEASSMHFQMIFTIANHLRCFAQDAYFQNVGSVLNADGCRLETIGIVRTARDHFNVPTRWAVQDSGLQRFNFKWHSSSSEKDKLGSSLKNFELPT